MLEGDGEARLTEWMDDRARLCWVVTPQPWELETLMISSGPILLLNIKGATHPFAKELRQLRSSNRNPADHLWTN